MDIPKNDKYSLVIDSPALVHQPIGVSYDIIDDRVYWTDVSRKVIMSSSMAGTMIKTWNSSDIVKPEFLAIDYIGRNIYFSDSKLKSISACKIADEVYCKVRENFLIPTLFHVINSTLFFYLRKSSLKESPIPEE